MHNKRAQSDVVSTVLIILLVVAAVAIIGAIILNVVNKGGSSVSGATACQAVDVHPSQCTIVGGNTAAVAQRGSVGGSTDATIQNVTYIFYKSDGTTDVNSSAQLGNIANVGGTATGNFAGIHTSVKTAVTLKLSDGSITTCDPSTVQVACS